MKLGNKPKGRVAVAYEHGVIESRENRKRVAVTFFLMFVVVISMNYYHGDLDEMDPNTFSYYKDFSNSNEAKKEDSKAEKSNSVPEISIPDEIINNEFQNYSEDGLYDDNENYYDDGEGYEDLMLADELLGEVEMDLLEDIEALLDEAEQEVENDILVSVEIEGYDLESILKKHKVNTTDEEIAEICTEVFERSRDIILEKMKKDIDLAADKEISDIENETLELENSQMENAVDNEVLLVEGDIEKVVDDVFTEILNQKFDLNLEFVSETKSKSTNISGDSAKNAEDETIAEGKAKADNLDKSTTNVDDNKEDGKKVKDAASIKKDRAEDSANSNHVKDAGMKADDSKSAGTSGDNYVKKDDSKDEDSVKATVSTSAGEKEGDKNETKDSNNHHDKASDKSKSKTKKSIDLDGKQSEQKKDKESASADDKGSGKSQAKTTLVNTYKKSDTAEVQAKDTSSEIIDAKESASADHRPFLRGRLR